MLASLIGRRNISFIQTWSKTGAVFGVAAGAGMLYLTDWKLVLQYLPIYNTKFKESEN